LSKSFQREKLLLLLILCQQIKSCETNVDINFEGETVAATANPANQVNARLKFSDTKLQILPSFLIGMSIELICSSSLVSIFTTQ
jgi:hypothetical protein